MEIPQPQLSREITLNLSNLRVTRKTTDHVSRSIRICQDLRSFLLANGLWTQGSSRGPGGPSRGGERERLGRPRARGLRGASVSLPGPPARPRQPGGRAFDRVRKASRNTTGQRQTDTRQPVTVVSDQTQQVASGRTQTSREAANKRQAGRARWSASCSRPGATGTRSSRARSSSWTAPPPPREQAERAARRGGGGRRRAEVGRTRRSQTLPVPPGSRGIQGTGVKGEGAWGKGMRNRPSTKTRVGFSGGLGAIVVPLLLASSP